MQHIAPLTLSEFVNCVLVANNKRSAYLMQYIDYRELSIRGPIMTSKIQRIAELFPSLCSYEYTEEKGMLFSAEPLSAKQICDIGISDLLDYPCGYFADNSHTYDVNVSSTIEGEVSTDQLYGFAAGGDHHREVMEERVIAMQIFLDGCEIVRDMGITVSLNVKENISVNDCISALLSGNVTVAHKVTIMNNIYNLLEDKNFAHNIIMRVEWENEKHIGILVTMMLHFKHNPLEPFYPFCGKVQDELSIAKSQAFAEELELLLALTGNGCSAFDEEEAHQL